MDLSLIFSKIHPLERSDELQYIIESKIESQKNILGLIIIQNGTIISESYYNGSSKERIHNIYSVTKSYMSTLIGQAIDKGIMYNVDSSFSKFIPKILLITNTALLYTIYYLFHQGSRIAINIQVY